MATHAQWLMTQSTGSPVNLASYTPDIGSGVMIVESGTSDIKVRSGTGRANSDPDDSVSYHQYNVTVPNADQSITVVATADVAGASVIRHMVPALRWQADGKRYQAQLIAGTAAVLQYWDGSTNNVIATSGGNCWEVGDSATWKFEVVGTALTLYKNGSSFLTGTDSNLSAAGKAGIAYQRNIDYDSIDIEYASAGPVLSTPTVVSTGNTIATVRVTTDTAPTGSSILAVRTRPAGDPAWTEAEVLASPTATITSGSSGARDFNLTGLTNGTALAADFAQTGSNVVSTASFTPSTVPGAPTIGTATAGNAQATVAGTAPGSNGGSAITGYRSTATPGGSTVTGASLPITHTGLTNGTAYTFTLAAQNANGYGAESAASNSVTPSSGADVTPPTLTSPSGAGGTLTCSGSVTTDEANGTLYTVATASATAPTALQVEAGQDHTGAAALRVVSQAVSASGSQAVASGAVTAGTRYLHFMHKDAAGNRSSVASSAAFTVSASVSATYTATTDILARNGIALASTPIFWSWLPAGRPGAVGSVVNGTGTTDSAGRYTLSQSAAGQGLLLIGLALGSWDADAPGFAQYLTLA